MWCPYSAPAKPQFLPLSLAFLLSMRNARFTVAKVCCFFLYSGPELNKAVPDRLRTSSLYAANLDLSIFIASFAAPVLL